MSNRRRPTMAATLKGYAAHYPDAGCDQCNAELEVRPHPDNPNMVILVIRHDDGCPVLAAMNPDLRPPLW